ncbi:MAG: glutathione S-transferase N-terminal domain-containing protein [Pseudomonadota bacterium]
MQLFYARPSPFVRKVMVMLAEAGQTDAVTLIDGFGSPVDPNAEVVASNPLGKIPCLVLDNGDTLYDSRVITRYLDARFGTALYPEGDALWRTLTLESHADGMLDASILCVYEVRCRAEGERSTDWVAGQRDKIARGLDALETRWLDYLNGPVEMGHLAIGCALEYLDFRREMGGWDDWRTGRPGLSDWIATVSARPSMQATRPE